MIAREASIPDAADAIQYVTPVGAKEFFVERALASVAPFRASLLG
jgi:hypothetical protein